MRNAAFNFDLFARWNILQCLHACVHVCGWQECAGCSNWEIRSQKEAQVLKDTQKCDETEQSHLQPFSSFPVLNLWNCFRAYKIDLRAKAKLMAWGTERRSWKHKDCPVHIRHQLLRLHGVKSSNKGLQDAPTEAATGLAPYWRQGGRAGWSSHLHLWSL